jgi:hypothetical protein
LLSLSTCGGVIIVVIEDNLRNDCRGAAVRRRKVPGRKRANVQSI